MDGNGYPEPPQVWLCLCVQRETVHLLSDQEEAHSLCAIADASSLMCCTPEHRVTTTETGSTGSATATGTGGGHSRKQKQQQCDLRLVAAGVCLNHHTQTHHLCPVLHLVLCTGVTAVTGTGTVIGTGAGATTSGGTRAAGTARAHAAGRGGAQGEQCCKKHVPCAQHTAQCMHSGGSLVAETARASVNRHTHLQSSSRLSLAPP